MERFQNVSLYKTITALKQTFFAEVSSVSIEAKVTHFSFRNCLDPKSFNNKHHLQPAAVNPVARLLHLPPKSVDDGSDVSSWGELENFSTTGDESSSTKGCDFGVIPLASSAAGECFEAIGCRSSSKESSIADLLTSSHYNCQTELPNTEHKGGLNFIFVT